VDFPRPAPHSRPQPRTHWRSALRGVRLTGHKTGSLYQCYAIADERDLRVAVERLDAMASAR
jgi:hypothetical protein